MGFPTSFRQQNPPRPPRLRPPPTTTPTPTMSDYDLLLRKLRKDNWILVLPLSNIYDIMQSLVISWNLVDFLLSAIICRSNIELELSQRWSVYMDDLFDEFLYGMILNVYWGFWIQKLLFISRIK
ncbi:Uncharacterized protein Fot_33176 [Forsythia ovata]|uniref:Ion transport domain-containing protein n=1 Tax=Forsythia ovata TaxID=205694 RepID=A0ABD1TA08_9LAMI